MLPKFPEFKPLEITDQTEIEKIAGSFPPYSDHHFMGLFTYDDKNQVKVSNLNGNLVNISVDYLTRKEFCSFIGSNQILKTMDTLIDYSQRHLNHNFIKLIPEHVINLEKDAIEAKYNIIPDRDNDDYIIDILDLIELSGKKYHSKRQRIHNFIQTYGELPLVELDLSSAEIQDKIGDLFLIWERLKDKKREDTEVELAAMHKYFKYVKHFNTANYGIFYHDRLIGYSLNEPMENKYYIGHFGKVHPEYKGASQYIEYLTALNMKKLGMSMMNYEQDLGIPGLRESKLSWNPCYFLKKYTVSTK